MNLFSSIERTCLGPRNYVETSFEYLDRSARPEAVRVRTVFEKWYGDFPDQDGDLAARFRSRVDTQSAGAAFELFLHQLLLGLGCTVHVHPETESGKGTRPDFLVRDKDHREFYLEATVVTDRSETDRAAEARKHAVYQAIERVSCPNFYLLLDVKGDPKTPPPAAKLRAFLKRWLESLDPDALIRDGIDAESLPRCTWKHDDWKIAFTAAPRSPERRGNPDIRVIGALMTEPRWVATWQSIRNSVVAKGNRYGNLGKPLVVAVNVGRFDLDRIDEMNALFGQESYVFSCGDLTSTPRMMRQRDGVWHGVHGPQYRRISAVLVAKQIEPWTIAKSNVTLYLNPWAEHPLFGPLHELDRALPEDSGKMRWVAGRHPREILDLAEGWPKVP